MGRTKITSNSLSTHNVALYQTVTPTGQSTGDKNDVASVKEIKKWSSQQLIEFLEKKKDELFLKPEHIKIIEDQDIAGLDFLLLTKEELMQCGLKVGPAKRISQFVKEFKCEEQAPATQALQLELETEKRKRAEVDLSLEREKRKRLRAETEVKISHYETILYATTHSLTKTWDLIRPQCRRALWFEPAIETLTFDRPPASDAEEDYQKYFTEEILTQLDDGSVKAVDSHRLMFLNGKAPNIATHTKGYSLTSHTVESIGEIKCQGSCFTKNNLGQVLQYAIIVLNHQRSREQVTGFLTDCHHIIFIQVNRGEDDRLYSVEYSDQMSLSDPNTTQYLRALLSVIQFHPMTGLRVDLDDVIAHTPISTIFSIVDDENAVVKLVDRSDVLKNEIRILEKLKLHEISNGIIELVNSSANAMILRPRAVTSFKETLKPVSCLAEIVDKLYLCHQIGVVHGDVRLTNILVDKDHRLILADFGCGSIVGEQWNGYGQKLPFRSLRLMKSKFPIFIQPQDDLFMLVQSLYLHLHEKEILATVIDFSDPSDVLEFWEKVFSDELWGKIRVSCENLKYDALKEFILQIP